MIDQGELFDIPSPCRRICEVNNRGYCKGCFRSREERLNWLKYSDFQRQLIVNLCEKRRQKVLASKLPQPEENEDFLPTPQFDLFTASEASEAPEAIEVMPASVSESASTPAVERNVNDIPAPATERPQTSLFSEEAQPQPPASTSDPQKAKPARKAPVQNKDDQIDLFS